MLVVLFFLLRRRKRQTEGTMTAADQAQASAPKVIEVVEKDAPAVVVPGRTNKPSTVAAQPITEDPQKLYIREQIQMLGKSNPATVAQLIQTWMDEDRRN
jgi:flagellar biosynthesis/type III secretory pathway M-ring protein FliF/YscJ